MTSSTEPYSRSSTEIRIAAAGWLFCAIFFFYAFILRVAPAVMVDDLMREFSVGAAILGNLSAVYLYIYAGLQIPVGLFIDRHGLKNLCQELIGVDISKQQQMSDWGAEKLTNAQLDYAASDVLYLHRLREELNERLEREGRMDLAQSCFDFLPTRAKLDLAGWPEIDIFAH